MLSAKNKILVIKKTMGSFNRRLVHDMGGPQFEDTESEFEEIGKSLN